MNIRLDTINDAIVRALAYLHYGDSRYSAKALQGTIHGFYVQATGTDGSAPRDYDGAKSACEAIFAALEPDASCRHSQLMLICQISELSESYMARFRQERDAGTYTRNPGYIEELCPDNEWGSQMTALKEVFPAELILGQT